MTPSTNFVKYTRINIPCANRKCLPHPYCSLFHSKTNSKTYTCNICLSSAPTNLMWHCRFLEIDDNHDGKVSASELGTVLKSCGMHLEPHQLNALISKFHNKKIKPDIGLNRVSNPDVALNQNTYVVSTRKSNSKRKRW